MYREVKAFNQLYLRLDEVACCVVDSEIVSATQFLFLQCYATLS